MIRGQGIHSIPRGPMILIGAAVVALPIAALLDNVVPSVYVWGGSIPCSTPDIACSAGVPPVGLFVSLVVGTVLVLDVSQLGTWVYRRVVESPEDMPND